MPSIPRLTREKKARFIETLRRTGNVSAAAKEIGVPPARIYAKRQRDQSFKEDWDAAIEGALDDLEEEVRRRALEGIEKPVYYAGKKCGSITSFNDTLAMFLLKAKRPQVFGDGAEEGDGGFQPSRKPREKLLKKLADMKKPKGEEGD